MAATKQEAAARAAKKILGHFSPTQGVPWETLRQAAEKQVAARRQRNDTGYTVTLNEAAGLLALEPDRLRRLVVKHPFGPPPLFSRPASKVSSKSVGGGEKPVRKPNTVQRASLVRLFDWHDALVAQGAVEPIGERIHPDARVGGTDNAFVARDRIPGRGPSARCYQSGVMVPVRCGSPFLGLRTAMSQPLPSFSIHTPTEAGSRIGLPNLTS